MRFCSLFLLLAGALAPEAHAGLVQRVPGEAGMLDINITLVFQAVNYAVFILLMDRVLFRPMLAHLDARRSTSDEAEDTADKATREARRAERERRAKLDEAYGEASKERARLRGEAVDEVQVMLHEARVQADEQVQAAQDAYAEEAKAAEEALQGQLDELAGLVKAKVLGAPGEEASS